MKGKESGGEEEIIHGMEVNPAHGGNDEHQEKEEEQRHGSKQADLSGQRSGLQLLWHGHADIEPRDQVVVSPGHVPAFVCGLLLGGRKRVLWIIYLFEVGGP